MLVLPVWRRKSMKPERSGRQLVPHHSPPVYVTSRPRIRAIENQRKGRVVTWNTVFKAGLWDLYVWWSNWHWTKELLMTLLLMSCSQSNAHFRRLVYTVYWGIWPSILKYKLSGNLVHHDNWSLTIDHSYEQSVKRQILRTFPSTCSLTWAVFTCRRAHKGE